MNTRLPLFHRGQTEQEAGESGASSIVGAVIGGETVGELVVAAVLEKSPHRPDIATIGSAEFEAVSSLLPTECVAALGNRVPCLHGSRRIVIPHWRVALHVKEGRAKSADTAKSHTLNLQLRDDVVGVCVLIVTVHGQARGRDRRYIHAIRTENLGPRN